MARHDHQCPDGTMHLKRFNNLILNYGYHYSIITRNTKIQMTSTETTILGWSVFPSMDEQFLHFWSTRLSLFSEIWSILFKSNGFRHILSACDFTYLYNNVYVHVCYVCVTYMFLFHFIYTQAHTYTHTIRRSLKRDIEIIHSPPIQSGERLPWAKQYNHEAEDKKNKLNFLTLKYQIIIRL